MRKLHASLLPATVAALLAACTTVGALLADRVAFTAPQLQGYLDRRFPRDYDKLGGLVTLSVLNPRLSIPPGDSRLRLDFDVGFGGLGRDSRTPSGRIAIASGLRYDVQARGLYMDNPTIESMELPKLGGALGSTGRTLVNRWLQDYAREEPLYRLDDSVAGRIGARRIDRTSIEGGQVVVHLGE